MILVHLHIQAYKHCALGIDAHSKGNFSPFYVFVENVSRLICVGRKPKIKIKKNYKKSTLNFSYKESYHYFIQTLFYLF